jgi:hypothetical protein
MNDINFESNKNIDQKKFKFFLFKMNFICYFGLFLILYVQSGFSFEFTECIDKPLFMVENGVAKLSCSTDDWFGYCSLINKKTSKRCTVAINHSNYASKQSDCKQDKRIDFAGDANEKKCSFTIKDVRKSGMWQN